MAQDIGSWTFDHPVRIEFENLSKIQDLVHGKNILVVTSPSASRFGWMDRLNLTPRSSLVIDTVPSHPDFSFFESHYEPLDQNRHFDFVVGIGSGSVLDASKVFATRAPNFKILKSFVLNGGEAQVTKMILIPTTAGSGSEVTPWGTVWDRVSQKKHSIHSPHHFAHTCLIMPELTLTLPRELTIQTGLDALSHSLEVLWHKNHHPIAESLASNATRIILDTLPQLIENLDSLELRRQMSVASLQAGLALSQKSSALAHAISYQMTLVHKVPHGIACSFTLPRIAQLVLKGHAGSRVKSLVEKTLGPKADCLESFFQKLGVPTRFKDYGLSSDDLHNLKSSLTHVSRTQKSALSPDIFFKEAVL